MNQDISVCVCVCVHLSARSLHWDFKGFSVPITCLCRGPLKPKLAAMRSAWSSRTPSNISMTSCQICSESERERGEKRMERESETEQGAQTLDYNFTQFMFISNCRHRNEVEARCQRTEKKGDWNVGFMHIRPPYLWLWDRESLSLKFLHMYNNGWGISGCTWVKKIKYATAAVVSSLNRFSLNCVWTI